MTNPGFPAQPGEAPTDDLEAENVESLTGAPEQQDMPPTREPAKKAPVKKSTKKATDKE